MAVLKWGKPEIEFIKLVNGDIPAEGVWSKMPNPKEGTFVINQTEGERKEAKGEGGILVDVDQASSTYTMEMDIFAAGADFVLPIPAKNGAIADEYAVRFTPFDTTLAGAIFKRTRVAIATSMTTEDGMIHHYTFTALQPKGENDEMMMEYRKLQ